MQNQFITAYCEALKRLGFNAVFGNERYVEVQKSAGQAVNIGVVIDTSLFEQDTLKEFIDSHSDALAERAKDSRFKNIFVAYILVTDAYRREIESLLENAEEFLDQRIYNIYWSVTVTPENCAIDRNKKQPDELGGMSRAIASAFQGQLPAQALTPVGAQTFLTYIFIALNGAAFALMGIAIPASEPYREVTAGAIVPELVFEGQYWRLLSAMFIHFDVMHLAANCLSIYIFGAMVERFLGGAKFLGIYFVSGLFASALCLTQAGTVSAGASGAVYGLIGATAVIAWRSRGRSDINLYNLGILIAVGIGVSFIVPGISYTAHIGGLIAGTLLSLSLSR